MAPGLPDLASVKAVCAAISEPFNFMTGIPGKSFSVAELEAAGVRRISLAGSLYRAAMSELVAAAREARERLGTSTRRCRRPSSPDSCGGERSAMRRCRGRFLGQRPSGTEGWPAEKLATLVTRDGLGDARANVR